MAFHHLVAGSPAIRPDEGRHVPVTKVGFLLVLHTRSIRNLFRPVFHARQFDHGIGDHRLAGQVRLFHLDRHLRDLAGEARLRPRPYRLDHRRVRKTRCQQCRELVVSNS